MFFLNSASANGEPPFGVPDSSGEFAVYICPFSLLPNLSLPNGSFCVPTIDAFSGGRPTGRLSSYPGGTSCLPTPFLPTPYSVAKSCGVPYDLPVLAGSLPSF